MKKYSSIIYQKTYAIKEDWFKDPYKNLAFDIIKTGLLENHEAFLKSKWCSFLCDVLDIKNINALIRVINKDKEKYSKKELKVLGFENNFKGYNFLRSN